MFLWINSSLNDKSLSFVWRIETKSWLTVSHFYLILLICQWYFEKMQSFWTHPKHLLEMEEKGFSKGLFEMRMKYLYVFLWIDDSRIQSFVVLIAIGNDRIWFEIFRCKLVNTFGYEMAKTHIAINYSIQYIRNMNRFKCTLVDLNDPFEYL